jgi:hypothetical protein
LSGALVWSSSLTHRSFAIFSIKDGGKDRIGETNMKSIEQQERSIASREVAVNGDNQHEPEIPEVAPEDLSDFDVDLAMHEAQQNEEAESLKASAIDLVDLLGAGQKPPVQYIPDLAIAGGLTMFSGSSKSGKSVFWYHALAALANGESFLGSEPLTPVPVVYASEISHNILRGEGQWRDVTPKVRKHGLLSFIPIERNGRRVIYLNDEGKLDAQTLDITTWSEQIEFWVSHLKAQKAKILVIDTLMEFLCLNAGELFDPGIIRARLRELQRRVFEYDRSVAVVILHHTRKAQGRSGAAKSFDDAAGSFMLGAITNCNAIWSVTGKDKQLRKLQIQNRQRLPQPRTLLLEWGKGYQEVQADAPNEQDSPQQTIAGALMMKPELGELSNKKLAAALKVTEHQVRKFREDNKPAE